MPVQSLSCALSRACISRLALRFILAWLVTVTLVPELFAASGGEVSLPPRGRKVRNNLRLTVDDRGVDAPGYRPVKITATDATGPVTSERTLRVVIYPNRYDPLSGFDHAVTGYVEIPTGAISATTTILVPQETIWHNMMVEVYEDGRYLEDVSGAFGLSRTNWQNSADHPAILFIDHDVPLRAARETIIQQRKLSTGSRTDTFDLPDFRRLLTLFPDYRSPATDDADDVIKRAPDSDLLMQMADMSMMEMLPFEELPTRWLELSCYDIIVINRQDLKELAEKHPSPMRAVRDWLATGQVLAVYGAGGKWEHLEEIEETLQLNQLKSDAESQLRGWTLPPDNAFRGNLDPPYLRNGWNYNYNQVGKPAGKMTVDRSQKQIALRPADLGTVVAWQKEDIFPGNNGQWLVFLNAITPTRWHHSARIGVSQQQSNPQYWSFLIPGVGQAPVMSFVILITLFMIAIGPVNYWVVRRLQRSYLLLITVPTCAFVVTLGLFLYAIVTEGFQVKTRIRSFTSLDTTHGRASSLSRQSYYASLTPSAGLFYPDQEAVYPLMPVNESYRRSQFGRKLIWEEAGQRLKANYIYPRTVSQFVTAGTQSSDARLTVRGTKGEKTNREVTNGLGCRIKYLQVFDENGLTLFAENIAVGERASLQTTWQDNKFKWEQYFEDHAPKELVNFNPTQSNLWSTIFEFNPRIFGQPNETDSRSLLELYLLGAQKPVNAAGSFVAIVEKPAAITLGLKNSVEKDSFHVIQGNW